MVNKEISLTKEQLLKKKELLTNLQKEIKDIDFMINHHNLINIKSFIEKKTKIFLRFNQLILPYALALAITIGTFSSLGAIPFVRDEKKKSLQIKKEWDSFGNSKQVTQYDEFNDIGMLYYYEKWQSIDNNFYSRKVLKYDISDIDEEVISKTITGGYTTLNDVFGNPISTTAEVKSNLSQEEIEQSSYLKAIIYSTDENDYIVVHEDLNENLGETFLWFLITIILELACISIRSKISSFDYLETIKKINENYSRLNVEELENKLEIKLSNYRALTR